METLERLRKGDFTYLANHYAQYRPNYSETVLRAILGVVNQPLHKIDCVDVGAGTGIWTRMMAKHISKPIIAIEPNDAMRKQGEINSTTSKIIWQGGAAEKTNLADQSVDIISMASSFHWADFEVATQEFHRILKKDGYFVMVWNPRYLENNPLLLEIEQYIFKLNPNLNRVSSGKSQYVDDLAKKLNASSLFEDMIYFEGMHTAVLSKQQYIGIWQSVNDVRVQLGEAKFQEFLDFINEKIQSSTVTCTYKTRAWMVKKR